MQKLVIYRLIMQELVMQRLIQELQYRDYFSLKCCIKETNFEDHEVDRDIFDIIRI